MQKPPEHTVGNRARRLPLSHINSRLLDCDTHRYSTRRHPTHKHFIKYATHANELTRRKHQHTHTPLRQHRKIPVRQPPTIHDDKLLIIAHRGSSHRGSSQLSKTHGCLTTPPPYQRTHDQHRHTGQRDNNTRHAPDALRSPRQQPPPRDTTVLPSANNTTTANHTSSCSHHKHICDVANKL